MVLGRLRTHYTGDVVRNDDLLAAWAAANRLSAGLSEVSRAAAGAAAGA